MTDEEANQNTTLWPSKANIVRAVYEWRRLPAYRIGSRCTHCAISSAMHIQEMRSYSSVRILTALLVFSVPF